ncbi:MAG: type VI secretion system tip protein VgrG, partial [Deltaproteobacteria bacterium]|nr:type VI secretion system tip protein VgrG [Deltaproteobacteria bacterium]
MSPNGIIDRPQFAFEVLEGAGADADFGVFAFTASERISRPFDVRLTLVSRDEVKFDDVMNKEAVLAILGKADERRYFHGIINEFSQGGRAGEFYFYQARLVPALWRLCLEQDCRIFQEKKVVEIVQEVLEEGGITSDRSVIPKKLKDDYQLKTYCVQYRETDLNFISRLLEEEGIFYFFEHSKEKHVLILGDDPVSYKAIEGKNQVPYNDAESMVPKEDFISVFNVSRRVHTGKVTIKDYNFETPSVDLTEKSVQDPFKNLEVYDYPAEYGEQEVGKKIAKVRLEESTMFYEKAEGKSDCPRFIPGFTFKLTDHPRDQDSENWNQEYLLVDVTHRGTQPQVLEQHAAVGGTEYSNEFLCIKSTVPFRPERNTPKPVVEGVQTAIVVGAKGEEIYTDKHGRVKVQFHWDRKGSKDEKSSCWIRVGQVWAGRQWGAMFIPPPYNPEKYKTKSTIKSNTTPDAQGFNEIRFEDKKGEEQLFVRAQKDLEFRTKHDRKEIVENESHLIVRVDQVEKVEGEKHLTVSSDHNEKVDGTISIEAGQDLQEKVGGKHALDAAQEIHLHAGVKVIIEGGTQVSLKVGGNFVDIGP